MHFSEQRVPFPDQHLGHHGSKSFSDIGYGNVALVHADGESFAVINVSTIGQMPWRQMGLAADDHFAQLNT
jgi:hypothetical protein